MNSIFWYPGYELPLENIVRADNCSLFDEDGKRYVDLESGVWCTSVGHANPRVLRAMNEQAARISHTGYSYSNPVVDLAARETLSLLGFEGGKCTFLCSGSEAVEFGVRIAQTINDGSLLLTMADSYCGAYGSVYKKQADEWFCFDWTGCRDCQPAKNCKAHCEHFEKIPFEKIGGFLFEPGSSSGLVRFPPKKLVQNIVSGIKAKGGIILVNEVTTGVGRTGTWFGYQHYDISPDIVALGKGIGNGYPVSITAAAPGVIAKLNNRVIRYAQSHQNDPLGAAVVLEVIRVIRDEKLIEKGNRTAKLLLEGLQKVRSRTKKIRDIRARGLMIAIELEEDSEEASFSRNVQEELLREGYIIAQRPGLNVLRIDPSLTIDQKDIEGFLAAFEKVLTKPAQVKSIG
jgi:acetylornithine/N-succinyldiaminopimelate aminotransferase